jgi:hypothetical protein
MYARNVITKHVFTTESDIRVVAHVPPASAASDAKDCWLGTWQPVALLPWRTKPVALVGIELAADTLKSEFVDGAREHFSVRVNYRVILASVYLCLTNVRFDDYGGQMFAAVSGIFGFSSGFIVSPTVP